MKIAVTYENGLVFQHFGKTEEFAIYEFDHDLKLVSKKVTGTMGTSHGALAPFLASLGVDAVICGGLGLVRFANERKACCFWYSGIWRRFGKCR